MWDHGSFALEREDAVLECTKLKIMRSTWFIQVKLNKEKTVSLHQLKSIKKDYAIMIQNNQLLLECLIKVKQL